MLRIFLFIGIGFLISSSFSQDTVNQTDLAGRKQGFWRKYDKGGYRIYEGQFKDNIPYGKFTYLYRSGKVRAVSLISEEGRVARTTSWFPNGKMMAKGKYVNEKRDSLWQFFSEFDETLVSEEFYEDGMKVGIEKVYYPGKGLAETITWKDGKKEGPWEQFYDDGALKIKGTYLNDEKEGLIQTFFVSGNLLGTGQYKNGHQDGTWSFYDENGNLKLKEHYDMGILLKSEEFPLK
ncbi:MAG: hypothetical protein V1733_01615 [bacterium]